MILALILAYLLVGVVIVTAQRAEISRAYEAVIVDDPAIVAGFSRRHIAAARVAVFILLAILWPLSLIGLIRKTIRNLKKEHSA